MTLEEQRACMRPLQLAGLIIMENGGETFRVEETVTRMGRAFGLEEVETFSVPSGLFISYRMSDGNVETSVKRVRRSGNHLVRVDRVNAVSREMERTGMTPAEAAARLEEIRLLPNRRSLLPIGAAVCAAGFALLFGGGWPDLLAAFLLAGLVEGICMLLDKFHMQALVAVLLGSILTVLVPAVLKSFLPVLSTEAVIAGALMPLLPGLTMTTAVQDTMRGDIVSGLSHGIEAILTAGLVADGALIANAVFRVLTGGGLL